MLEDARMIPAPEPSSKTFAQEFRSSRPAQSGVPHRCNVFDWLQGSETSKLNLPNFGLQRRHDLPRQLAYAAGSQCQNQIAFLRLAGNSSQGRGEIRRKLHLRTLNLVGQQFRCDTGNRRLARRINRKHRHRVRIPECAAELVEEISRPGVPMGLEDNMYVAVTA